MLTGMSEVTAEPQPAAPEGRPAPERTAPERSGPDHTAPDHTAPDHTAPDRSGAERVGAERVGAERVGAERVGAERAGPGRSGPGRGAPVGTAVEWEAPAGGDRRAEWRESLRVGFWTWLAGLVMYVLVTIVNWLPFGDPLPLGKTYQAWNQWDTVWYVIIADSGYGYDPRGTAFFPLYPLLIRGARHVLPGGTFEAALILSVLGCLAALVMVHRLAAELMGPAIAKRTVFYLLAFPTGFYLAAAYNESLFIALAAGSLYCMRRRNWGVAAMLAGFASATRVAGVLLCLAFAYEYLRQRGFSLRRVGWDALWLALAPSGLLLYALYCARAFGDPLFFKAQQANWFHKNMQPPWTTLWQVTLLVVHEQPPLGADSIRNIANLSTAVAVLVGLVVALTPRWGLGLRQAYLVVFSAGIILMPLIDPIRTYYPLSSTWRFALECIPVFLVLAKLGRSARFDRVYTMAALGLQGVMILTFLHAGFVA
jgi:Mannosyltransferase (PIG-V)